MDRVCQRVICFENNHGLLRGAGFDPAERKVEWTFDPLNLIQVILAEGYKHG